MKTESPHSQQQETISLVIPVHNEEGNIVPLLDEIKNLFLQGALPLAEVIVVDDGSTDATSDETEKFSEELPFPLKLIRLRRKSGKSNALMLGFRRCQGSLIATLDGDGQDNPNDLPRLLETLAQGYDAISGWKKKRKDPLSKVVASRIFNLAIRLTTGLSFRDLNSGMKLYRRSAIQAVTIHGDLHRYLLVFLELDGFRVKEIPVDHRPRQYGRSKYGFARLLTGPLDLLTVIAFTKFMQKPAHLFGGLGLVFGVTGMIILTYLGFLWVYGVRPIGTRPLFFMGLVGVLLSVHFISFGILAEMILRTTRRRRSVSMVETEKNLGQ